MKELTTRKIVLGLLMTLVLALGVQSVVDALTFGTSRSGDLQTIVNENEFTISFSVSSKSNTHITHIDDERITQPWTTANGAPANIRDLNVGIPDVYYIDSAGYVLNERGGNRVNTAGVTIDNSGYQVDTDGNRVHAAIGGIAIDTSGFKLDANGQRVSESSDPAGITIYTLVDSDGGEVSVDNSGYQVDTNGNRVHAAIGGLAINTSGFKLDMNRQRVSKVSDPVGKTIYTLVDSGGGEVSVDNSGYQVNTTTGVRVPGVSKPTRASQYKPIPASQHKPEATQQVEVLDQFRYRYNEEAISIEVPAGTTLTKVGNYRVSIGSSDSPHTMDELANSVDQNKLTSSIRLTYKATTVGEKRITITDTTPMDDRLGVPAPSLIFTIYVVPAFAGETIIALASSIVNGYTYGNDNADRPISTHFTVTPTNNPIIYKVVHGPGQLYVHQGDTDTTPKKEVSTLAGAPVFLDMRGGSNKVTVWPRDRSQNRYGKSITYIFNNVTIELIGGNDQTGVPDSRLRDPLRIRVKDDKKRAVPGLVVSFTPASGATLQPVIGTTVYLTDPPADNTWASDFTTDVQLFSATTTVPAAIAENTSALVPTDQRGEAAVYLEVGAAGSKTVTVSAGGEMNTFFVTSSVSTDIPSLEIVSGNNQRSASNGKVADPLVVRVLASNKQPLPTQEVTFTTTKGYLRTTPGYELDTSPVNGPATQVKAKTDVNGKASVGYDLVNHEGASDVIAEISSATIPVYQRRVTFNINGRGGTTTTTQQTPRLTIATSDAGTTRSVTVNARGTTGQIVSVSIPVTLTGTALTAPRQVPTGTATEITLPTTPGTYTLVATDASGIYSQGTTSVTVDEETQDQSRSLSIDVTGTGATRSITVTATDGVRNIPGVTVRLRGSALTQGQRTVTVGTPITITLPTAPGAYNLEAAANGFTTSPVETFTVTDGSAPRTPAPTSGGRTLTVEKDGAQTGTQQPIRVRATPAPSRNLRFTVTRDDVRVGVGLILTTGTGTAIVTVPATGLYVLTVSAEGYTPKQVTFTAGTGTPTVSETPTSTSTAGDPSRIEIDGSSTRSGTEDTELEDPLRVRVLDDDDDPVRDARVIFRVRSGQGRLSQRGNGRATSANTNSRGYAAADYTPLSASSTVSASVNGVPVAVTFTISTGSAPPPTGPRDADAAPRPSRDIDPVVHVGAAHRAPMLWVDGGKIYALVGADVQEFASGVENVMNLAVGGGKVYWTEQTGDSSGTINSADLDGSDVEELKAIRAVPMGIAVDTAASKLYWTNSRGRIQSADLDGSDIATVLQNLTGPMDIAVARGNLYWTEYDSEEAEGNVGIANSSGRGTAKYISTGADMPGSLVIGSGKVYWTEMTGTSSGTINSANLAGTGATELADIRAVPSGIAVDGSRSKLYWTNSRGRVQSADLDGSGIRGVVGGLGSPGDMVLNNSIEAPTTETPPPTPGGGTTSNKYDVNGDGTVDGTDVDALLLAVLAELTHAKYDVNGDGAVDVKDVRAVNRNLDTGAAGAPTLLGMKMTAVQVDRLQEQIDLLIATGDRSPAAMKTLIYLQQLIVMARPEKTQLLANYPNPFNPETWIPYELATDTDVRLTIYNTQGVVIRSLQLGHQSGGYYTGRDRAAYWDGRNALGEQVASGLYFYQLETDEMSSMRKMVILK